MKRYIEKDFLKEINENGYCIIEDVLPRTFISQIKSELSDALKIEEKFHKTKNYQDYGMVLLCALYGGKFIDIFDFKSLIEPIESFLGKGCIVYAYTSSSMPPMKTNYSNRIHVDVPLNRLKIDFDTNFGAFIPLVDIDERNGSMHLLPKKYCEASVPSEKFFEKHSIRANVKVGSICFFSPKIWHKGGVNMTDKWRHAITINFCKPFMKQRIDIPRSLHKLDNSSWSYVAKQKLGFFAQSPVGYKEYYVVPEKRKFSQPYE